MSEQMQDQQIQLEQLDFNEMLKNFLKALRKTWWIVIALTVLLGAYAYQSFNKNYVPSYVANCTVSVTSSEDTSSSNAQSAEQLGKVFPYILTSGILSDIVQSDLGLEHVPPISVSAIQGTNLLTIKVTAEDADLAYQVLQSVIRNYPEVSRYVVGETSLTIIDDQGVPAATDRGIVGRRQIYRYALYGFALGILITLVVMAMNRTIRTKDDLQSGINAPYLGSLPFYHKKLRRSTDQAGISLLDYNVQRDYMEAINVVRTRIEREMEKTGSKVLMVTSSVAEEGKSTVLMNLAITFAQHGKRVTMIDCDFRNPSVQAVMNLRGSYPGIGRVISGEATLDEAVIHYHEHGVRMNIVPGASDHYDRTDLLASREFRALLEKMKADSDVILLDTPPLAMVADAELVTSQAELILYVVRSDYARRNYILRGISSLSELSGIKIGGCILNAVEKGHISARREEDA